MPGGRITASVPAASVEPYGPTTSTPIPAVMPHLPAGNGTGNPTTPNGRLECQNVCARPALRPTTKGDVTCTSNTRTGGAGAGGGGNAVSHRSFSGYVYDSRHLSRSSRPVFQSAMLSC